MDKQKELLKIVRRWVIKLTPEYRGFRCADCQRYLHKAWHYQLNYGGFKTPVHFCNTCQRKFGSGGKYKRSLESSYDSYYKIFTCDTCGENHFRMYHVWNREGPNLVETHFCKNCWLRTQGPTLRS